MAAAVPGQALAGNAAAQSGSHGAAVLLCDLSRLAPPGSVSRDGIVGTWHMVDYEIEEGKGVMLYGEPASKARPLTLTLGQKGWYQVRFGIYYGAGGGSIIDRILQVKLTSDPAYSRIANEPIRASKDGNYPEKLVQWTEIVEVFWKCADLTGQDLIIARPERGTMTELQSNLAYIRLVPMDEQQIGAWQAEQPNANTRLLVANFDGGNNRQWGVSTREDIRAEFEPLRETDFKIALYGVAAGPRTLYPSKVGELSPARFGVDGYPRICAKNGVDLLAEAIRAAHTCGVQLFPQVRVVGLPLPPRHWPAGRGSWIADHPEWLSTYPDGQPTRHLSFAIPQVREFYVRLLREWVEDYQADGVNVLFSRSYPFVYYERPVCDAFQKQYGNDMRQLPVGDRRVQKVRATFLTQFLREVRTMLDEVGQKQARYIPNCYLVPVNAPPPDITPEARASSLAECLFSALDVPVWISEGLVDYLCVHLHVSGEHDGTKVEAKLREFTSLASGSKTKVIADIYPRRMPPRQFRKVALTYYRAGADGLSFFDTQNRYPRASEWAFIKRLGHREQLSAWQGKGDDYYRRIPLRSLDGFRTDRAYFMPTDG